MEYYENQYSQRSKRMEKSPLKSRRHTLRATLPRSGKNPVTGEVHDLG